VPADSFAAFIKLAKENPGKYTYGSSGIGGAGHLAGELLKMTAGIDLVHVPFKGGGPALGALLGGEVDMLSATGIGAWPFIQQGRMKALAVSSLKRSAALPEVPTVAESGFPGFEERSWVGYFAPAKTPAAIVDRLNREINAVLALPDIAQSFRARGLDLHPGSSADFARHLNAEVAMWAKIIKTTGVKAD
jgi:tripartite-type tricarboxylate transporter receptor subunit TctC